MTESGTAGFVLLGILTDGLGIVENWDFGNEINDQIHGKSMDLDILRAPQHPYGPRYASAGFPAC